mgnify:FL=1
MAVVTFWSECKKEIGQTSTAIAVATQMAIEHNYKILLISTYNTNEIDKAFWNNQKKQKGLGEIFKNTKKINIDSGIQGLAKVELSNKLTPDIITNYSKIVFKNRLEVLDGHIGREADYKTIFSTYPEIIEGASRYYDMVIVDLNRNIEDENINKILEKSNVIVYGLNQKISTIDNFAMSSIQDRKNIVPYIGRYDKNSKYNSKNVRRYLRTKKEIGYLSYNTLFNDACEEGTVADLFLKLKQIKNNDEEVGLLEESKKISESIIYKIQELELKI